MKQLELPICINTKKSGTTILRAANKEQIIRLEGNWYFHPDLIDKSLFLVTDRLYTCPYKGTCNWVDLKTDNGSLPDIAWVYPQTLPDYQRIAGWFGFYGKNRNYEIGTCK